MAKFGSWVCEKCNSSLAVVLHVKDKFTEKVNDAFAWWAAIVYDNPYKCIIGTLLCTALMCIGFIPGIPKWIDGADPLYSLPYSEARAQGAIHRTLFNDTNSRPSFILITGHTPGENIFTWKHLEAVQQLDKLIRGQTVDPKLGRRIAIARRPEYHSDNLSIRRVASSSDESAFPPPIPDHQPLLNASQLGSSIPIEDSDPALAKTLIDLINKRGSVRRVESLRDPGERRLVQQGASSSSPGVLTFEDICVVNPFGGCQVTGVQEMGVFDMNRILPNMSDSPMLFLLDGLVFNTQYKAFPPHYLLGKAEEYPCSPDLPKKVLSLFYTPDRLMPPSTPNPGMARANMTCIKKAEAFQLIYEIEDRDEWTKRNEDWEKVMIDVLLDNQKFGPLKLSFNAFRSRDDALRSSTSESSDVLYVALTFAFLLAYSTSLNFSCDLYRSKSYPALAGVLASILGMIAGMGLISMCGIAFVPTALVCPFLVVGVGVDDMFVIINAYSLAYMIDSSRDRCILALKDTGLALSITRTTSLVSFLIGLNQWYLSIKNFCWFCGAGILFGWIFSLTFFFAVQCLDAKREEENYPCLFCVPNERRRELRREQLRDEGIDLPSTADISTFTLGALTVRRAEHDALRRQALRLKLKEGGGGAAMKALEGDGVNATPSSVSTRPYTRKSSSAKKRRPWCGLILLKKIGDLSMRFSDSLLVRVALEGHEIARKRDIPQEPSEGVLNFSSSLALTSANDDPLTKILAAPDPVPLYYRSLITGEKKLFLDEPPGTVGRRWRKLILRFYAPLLVHPVTKGVVLFAFFIFFIVAIYGCTQLQSGLDLRDLAPEGSYLRQFDTVSSRYFDQYDYPVDVFFPDMLDWSTEQAQGSLRKLQEMMRQSGSGKLVTDPLVKMLDDPELKPMLQSGERTLFERTLFEALTLENGKYKQFEQNFVWQESHLRAWKMQILPGSMVTSSDRAKWMTQIRADCDAMLSEPTPFRVMAWNYMMTFYESDLKIVYSVTCEMTAAGITMMIVAMVGIPQLTAALLVMLLMAMIDVGIIGIMYFWSVKLNMVSMICLLISVGFSVDFSAHVCHTFMDAQGQSRNQRAVESLVLMGTPVVHGAASTIIGIVMLGFSKSYIFDVFFKMMLLVMILALIHSIIFLPVILSIFGDAYPHHAHKQSRHSAKQVSPSIAAGDAISIRTDQTVLPSSASRTAEADEKPRINTASQETSPGPESSDEEALHDDKNRRVTSSARRRGRRVRGGSFQSRSDSSHASLSSAQRKSRRGGQPRVGVWNTTSIEEELGSPERKGASPAFSRRKGGGLQPAEKENTNSQF